MAWDTSILVVYRLKPKFYNILSLILVQKCCLFFLMSTKFESVASFRFDCNPILNVKKDGCFCDNSPDGSDWDIECPRGLIDVHNITIKVKPFSSTTAQLNIGCNAYNSDIEMAWRMLEGLDFREQEKESKFNVTRLSFDKCPLSHINNTLEDFMSHVKLKTSSITSLTFIPARNPHANATFQSLSNFINSLENLDTLDLKMNKLTDIPPVMSLTKLKDIRLMSNDITEISPPEVFKSKKSLKFLNLGFNKIEEIPNEVFPESLQTLHLHNNKISRISSQTFSNLKNLAILVLRNNPLLHIDRDAFLGLNELKSLDLYSTYFDHFPILRNLPKLQSINLGYRDHGSPTVLAQHFDGVRPGRSPLEQTTIAEIKIPAEKLEILPKDFNGSIGNLSSLSELILTSTGLDSLPVLEDYPNLAVIYLDRNRIKEIPKNSFRGLTSLIILNLSQNKIEVLEEIHAPNLNELDLSQNEIKTLSKDTFLVMSKLTKLKLYKNSIAQIHSKTFESLTNLKYLDLSENQISTLSHLAILPAAPIGKLDAVFVEEFGQQSVLRFCMGLEELYLRHNKIAAIYEDWKLLMSKLNHLDLSHNRIPKLDVFDINFFSRKLTMDVSFNEITSVVMDHADYLLDGAENRELVIKSDDNPLNCDCNQLAFKRFNLKGITFDYKNLLCHEPPNLKNIQFREVQDADLICKVPEGFGCPNICTCWKVPGNQTIVVDCSHRNLSDFLPNVDGLNATHGYNLALNLAGNGISALNPNHTKNLVDRVSTINFSENDLADLSFLSLLQENNDTTFYIAHNQFSCDDCEFHKTLRRHFKQISDYKNVTCITHDKNFGSDRKTIRWFVDQIPESKICPQDTLSAELQGLIIGVGIITACFVVLVAIYVRHGWALRAFLYSKGFGWFITEDDSAEDGQKIYDAFVSFSHKDEEWVLSQLVNRLEEEEGFKLCLHFRDWTPGDWIPEQIVRSVDKSRRTVVVLSKNFVESIWSQLEFKAAHSQALNEKGNRLILILIGEDLTDNDVQDSDLKLYMKMNTYLKWGDPWFWHKLKYALPHKKSLSVQNHYARQQQRERAIQLDKLRTKMENSVAVV